MNLRYICALLALILCLGLIVGCADGSKGGGSETSLSTGETTAEATTETVYKANTPEGLDYGGAEFNICTFPDSSANVYWVDVDFCATEENGDTINDATYQRKRAAEELLNLKIVNIPAKSSAGDQIKASVTTQDGAYDIGFIDTRSASTLSQTGTLLDFTSLSTLDMSAAWWDQNCIEDLSIEGSLYMLTGDIEIMYKKNAGH